MKLKHIILALSMSLVLGACDKDYLNTVPESSTSKATLFETTDNAKLVINGIMRSMYRQYLGTQGMNGEGTTKNWFGDWQGDDVHVVSHTGYAVLYNSNYIENNTSQYNYYMWYYYYKLIGNINSVIVNIDGASGFEVEKQYIKAQALTMRAYCYTRLSEWYCPRWAERTSHPQGLILRLDESTGDMAPSSQEDVYNQIFADLDEAISLYKASGLKSKDLYGNDGYVPGINLAYGVTARAALYSEDWAKAAENAKLAREGYSLMSVADYKDGGFSTPNSEWIFFNDGSATQTLHYYGYFSYNGASSSSSASKSYPKAINKVLYDQIPDTDIRKEMFLNTDRVNATLAAKNQFSDYTIVYSATSAQGKAANAEYPGKLNSASKVAAYMQFKFHGQDDAYNIGDICNMRASEMYLIEAEALARQGGKDAQVRQLLTELVKDSGRDPEFSTNLSGADLLAQVQLYRRIELWNEGFRWYDLKRNGEDRVRLTPEQGGNFGSAFAGTMKHTDKNNWVYVYPQKETDYNGAFKANTNPDKTEK